MFRVYRLFPNGIDGRVTLGEFDWLKQAMQFAYQVQVEDGMDPTYLQIEDSNLPMPAWGEPPRKGAAHTKRFSL